MCSLFHVMEQNKEEAPVLRNDKGKLWWVVNRGGIVLSTTLDCIMDTHKDPQNHGGHRAA